jgi:hypothetical protein
LPLVVGSLIDKIKLWNQLVQIVWSGRKFSSTIICWNGLEMCFTFCLICVAVFSRTVEVIHLCWKPLLVSFINYWLCQLYPQVNARRGRKGGVYWNTKNCCINMRTVVYGYKCNWLAKQNHYLTKAKLCQATRGNKMYRSCNSTL